MGQALNAGQVPLLIFCQIWPVTEKHGLLSGVLQRLHRFES